LCQKSVTNLFTSSGVQNGGIKGVSGCSIAGNAPLPLLRSLPRSLLPPARPPSCTSHLSPCPSALLHRSTIVYRDYVRLPTPDELVAFESRHRSRFKLPNCIGSVDGSFFHILQSEENERAYFCYKKYYAITILAVVDPDLKFVWFCAGVLGSVGDATAWNSTEFHRCLHQTRQYDLDPVYINPTGNITLDRTTGTRVDSFVVADSAFRLTRR
jgi:hypothetical protein